MNKQAGRRDIARTISLLWRQPETPSGRRGPKPALSTDSVVDAAIEVADANPTTPLSMRMIGDHLGRTAMSLYTYIPGKDELLDLMYDRVHAELPPIADTDDWRMALSDWAAALFALHTRHPWTLDVSLARPVLGPHEQAGLESLLSILYSTGLDAPIIRRSVSMLFHFIRGSARTLAEIRSASTIGDSESHWWAESSAALADAAPDFADDFPHTMQLGREAPPVPGGDFHLERETEESFTQGLQILLDGIGSRIRKHS